MSILNMLEQYLLDNGIACSRAENSPLAKTEYLYIQVYVNGLTVLIYDGGFNYGVEYDASVILNYNTSGGPKNRLFDLARPDQFDVLLGVLTGSVVLS